MAKIDREHMVARTQEEMMAGIGAGLDNLDKPKNEERNRSLSIAVGNGRSLIAVSEFGSGYSPNPKSERYALLVTKPGVDDTHVCIVLDVPDIHALIGILQEIVDEEYSDE